MFVQNEDVDFDLDVGEFMFFYGFWCFIKHKLIKLFEMFQS